MIKKPVYNHFENCRHFENLRQELLIIIQNVAKIKII
jgi:hypothetical protein